MRQLQDIGKERDDMSTIVNLTSVFESLASMHISQIKNQVQLSQKFFDELWHIYTQIRVDSLFRFGREDQEHEDIIDKELFIAITAEGGFSGDIDQKLIKWMLQDYDPEKHEIIVIGHHGAVQLAQAGVRFRKYFKLPAKDQNINVSPLIKYVREYKSTSVYYQAYVSLMVQEVKKIALKSAVQEAGRQSRTKKNDDSIISELNYIFEPSTFSVVAHLERSMLEISLGQVILDSKLAQYASRFRSMSAAKERAIESQKELRLTYNRAKRSISDERLKEIINGMKAAGARI